MSTDTTYRHSLDKSSKKFRCPNCQKKRFVRYVDNETGQYLEADIGRCDRQQDCGYHRKPKESASIDTFRPKFRPPKPKKKKADYHPDYYVKRSQGRYEINTLVKWLATLPGWDEARAHRTAELYKVGTTQDGWAIFWQMDIDWKVRAGKMIRYDDTGHRVKEGYSYDWIHSKLKKAGKLQEYNLSQCFFGLHLVDDSKPVAIVESEKTALIASQYLPQFHWIASGQLNGINEIKLRPLRGCNITLFPDIGAYDQWKETADKLEYLADIKVSDLLERKAPEQHKGYDIADYLIQYDIRDFTAPHGWNPWTGETFDQRGYPASWDDIAPPEPGTDEYIEAEREVRSITQHLGKGNF